MENTLDLDLINQGKFGTQVLRLSTERFAFLDLKPQSLEKTRGGHRQSLTTAVHKQ